MNIKNLVRPSTDKYTEKGLSLPSTLAGKVTGSILTAQRIPPPPTPFSMVYSFGRILFQTPRYPVVLPRAQYMYTRGFRQVSDLYSFGRRWQNRAILANPRDI
jgi:hypothetical protein